MIMERWRQRWQVSQIPERGRKIGKWAGPHSLLSHPLTPGRECTIHPSCVTLPGLASDLPDQLSSGVGWQLEVIHLMGWLFQSSAQYPKTCTYPSRRFSLIVVMIELTEISRKLEKLCSVTFHFLSNGNWKYIFSLFLLTINWETFSNKYFWISLPLLYPVHEGDGINDKEHNLEAQLWHSHLCHILLFSLEIRNGVSSQSSTCAWYFPTPVVLVVWSLNWQHQPRLGTC